MKTNVPNDVKTYTAEEAHQEWDQSNEAKRRMILARIAQRESGVALKNWIALNAKQKAQIHNALNEDFFCCTWYINKSGDRIDFSGISYEKSPDVIDFERGQEYWYGVTPDKRFNALLECGMGGKDATQGQYATWGDLSPELRHRLLKCFDEKAKKTVEKPEANGRRSKVKIGKKDFLGTDPRQLDLFS